MSFVAIILTFILILIAVTDLTYRVGRARRQRFDQRAQGLLATLQAGTLGLLALMIGFTMSMAESRFDARRKVNVAEAAAVNTSYLSAELLPEPQQSESRAILRQYTAERRAYYHATGEEAARTLARTHEAQTQLWARAMEVANAHPEWNVLTTYLTSLSQMFDLEAARSLAVAARLPTEILVVLLMIALAGVGITGFVAGISGGRNASFLVVIPVLVATTCAIIVDLDRSWFGFISTGDTAMERVEHTIETEHPSSGPRPLAQPSPR